VIRCGFVSFRRGQGLIRVIFEPSRVRLYISPFWSSTKPMDRAREVVGVDRAVGAERDQHHRSVDAHLPPGRAIELIESVAGHDMMISCGTARRAGSRTTPR